MMVAMAAVALVAREITLWGLIELKMELLIQCVPAFLLALHWPGMRARPALAGLLVGTTIAVSGVALGVPRLAGIHTGVVGLGVNLLMVVLGSFWEARLPRPTRE